MVRPEEITGFLDTRWFDSLAGIGSWAVNIVASIFLLFVLWVLWTTFEHKIKVTVFPVFGAESDEQNVMVGHPIKLRGRDIKDKGIRKFSIMQKNFVTRKKVEDVPYEWRYPDGVWFLRPSKDQYIAIPRPFIDEDGQYNIRVPDTGMDLWQQAAEADLRRRTQDENQMKMQVYMTAAIIIGAFILAGVIIWLSMSFAGKSIGDVLTKVEPMTQALQNLAGNQGPG